MIMSHIPNSVNVDKFNTLLIFRYVCFLYVPSAITSNHGPTNRLLWIPEKKNDFSLGRVSSKEENDNAIQWAQEIRGIRTGEGSRGHYKLCMLIEYEKSATNVFLKE